MLATSETLQTTVRAGRLTREKMGAGLGLASALIVSALLNLWNLAQNGYGNEYYSVAVQSMVSSWKNFFYAAYLLKKHTGADLGRTLGTVVGERMADVLALVALLLASGLLILGTLAGVEGNLPLILLVGLGLAAAIVGAVVGLRLGAAPLTRRLPARWQPTFTRFTAGLLRTFRRDIQAPLYALTGLIWAGEVLRIWLVLASFHITGLAPGVVVFTALAGSLLSTIPFTPAGLGVVEGASVTILRAFGVATGLAGAVAILDRVINYWSNLPVGALLYLTSSWK